MRFFPEYPLSATRCRLDYQRINAGVVALGESFPLIAAERPFDPKLYANACDDRMLPEQKTHHYRRINAGVVALGESFPLIAAERPFDPKLYANSCDDRMLPEQKQTQQNIILLPNEVLETLIT